MKRCPWPPAGAGRAILPRKENRAVTGGGGPPGAPPKKATLILPKACVNLIGRDRLI